jgi:hypothetical protein
MAIQATLFGESASCGVVSVDDSNVAEVLSRARTAAVPAVTLGRVGGDRIRLAVAGEWHVDVAVAAAEDTWAKAVERKMDRV